MPLHSNAYFDTEAVARNAVAHVAARKRPPEPTPRPTIPPRAGDLLTERVESKIRDQLDQRLNDPEKSFLDDMEFLGLKREASVATATIRDGNRGSETKLRLVQSADRRWKVVDLDLQTIGMSEEDTILEEPVPAGEREEATSTTASRRHAAPSRNHRPGQQRLIGNR